MGTVNEVIAFKKYISNLPEDKCLDFINTLEYYSRIKLTRYCNRVFGENFISLAFDWEVSASGFKYWSKINNEWKIHLDNLKNIDFNVYTGSKCKSIW